MHYIDHPSADQTDPLKRQFRNADVASGIAPTVVTADILNDLQNNICHVIEQAGGTLSKGAEADLYDAVQALIAAAIAGLPPATVVDASETVRGIIEVATVTESLTGTDAERAVTPEGLKAAIDAAVATIATGGGGTTVPATTSTPGIAELATLAETLAGTDNQRIVTPSTLHNVVNALIQAAIGALPQGGSDLPLADSATLGIAEYATLVETDEGTHNQRMVTPLGLHRVVDTKIDAAISALDIPPGGASAEASLFQKGIVELATNVETDAGVDATRAVTPAGFAFAFFNYWKSARRRRSMWAFNESATWRLSSVDWGGAPKHIDIELSGGGSTNGGYNGALVHTLVEIQPDVDYTVTVGSIGGQSQFSGGGITISAGNGLAVDHGAGTHNSSIKIIDFVSRGGSGGSGPRGNPGHVIIRVC